MKLYTIDTGYFRLDGGAMFGVVPKSLWNKANPADENNMCNWAMRCLLIEDGDRLILIDNGLGDKQSEKFFSYYFLNGEDTLVKSLAKYGFSPEDITHNFLTHLHFDHCGGGVKWNKNRTGYETTFPNARYLVNKEHWELALNPNAREKASFLKENLLPMQEAGQLDLIEEEGEVFPGFNVKFVHGHTDAMMIPYIKYKDKTIVYMADLLPSAAHVPIPWVMAYDTKPLVTLEEKEAFMPEAVKNDYILYFEHDPVNECGTLQQTERGIKIKDTFRLDEIA